MGDYLTIELYDALGRLIYQKEIENAAGAHMVDLSGMPAAMFYFKVLNGKTLINQGKLMKQK